MTHATPSIPISRRIQSSVLAALVTAAVMCIFPLLERFSENSPTPPLHSQPVSVKITHLPPSASVQSAQQTVQKQTAPRRQLAPIALPSAAKAFACRRSTDGSRSCSSRATSACHCHAGKSTRDGRRRHASSDNGGERRAIIRNTTRRHRLRHARREVAQASSHSIEANCAELSRICTQTRHRGICHFAIYRRY